MSAIVYRRDCPEQSPLFALYESSGWNGDGRISAEQLFAALPASWAMVSAYDGERLVGFGRVLSDGVLHALICEMIVLPAYQGQGIGREIMTRLITRCRESGIVQIQLFCASGKQPFYQKLGFQERPVDAPGMQFNDSLPPGT